MPKRTDIHSILIIGSGPIVIGQGCEFDYSGVQACRALREEGYRVVLINSNPATIMTDPEFADATYIEPITPEAVEKILVREKANGTPIDALLPTLGGQTGLNTGMACFDKGILQKHGVKMIGADREAIFRGEDRQRFKELMIEIGLKVPASAVVKTFDQAREALNITGLPAIIRPAFTLGGTGGGIAYNHEEFETIVRRGLDASPVGEVLIEQSVIGWKEFEMEVVRDKNDNAIIICSIENIDAMGVHTGDSITVAPIQTLTDKEYQKMRDASIAVIRAVGVETGGSNIQFGINPKNGEMVVIEMNPRVSRSSALASKATGYPIAKIAAKLAVGYTLDELPNPITTRKRAPHGLGNAPQGLDTVNQGLGNGLQGLDTVNQGLGNGLQGLDAVNQGLDNGLQGLDAVNQSLDNGLQSLGGVNQSSGSVSSARSNVREDYELYTSACFEPTIDYVVIKIPRWTFEKFPDADETLTTQMKSVGEAMAIGRTFKEALQKGIRSMEVKRFGFGLDAQDKWLKAQKASALRGTGVPPVKELGRDARATQDESDWPIAEDKLRRKLAVPSQGRLYYVRYALKMGWSVEQVHQLTHIDPWFLGQMKELVEFERSWFAPEWSTAEKGEIAGLLRQAKKLGYSDTQIANVWVRDGSRVLTQEQIRQNRRALDVQPVYKLVDTCAAEFEAATPYYYSTYESPVASIGNPHPSPPPQAGEGAGAEDEIRLTSRPKVIIIGGGPNRIGQGIEFDYCCVQAAFAMRELNLESVMINSNPETVSTDYDTSDLLFFEPLTHEDVLNICERLNGSPFSKSAESGVGSGEARTSSSQLPTPHSQLVRGVIVQLGGQTPLNLARGLTDAGVPILGTPIDSLDRAGDRELFRDLLKKLGLKQPPNGIARNVVDAKRIANEVTYPVLVRPSFVLGGRAMEIVYDDAQLDTYMRDAIDASTLADKPILIDKFLDNADECDLDVIADYESSDEETKRRRDEGRPDENAIVIGVMEHIEEAGIHSGDSACVLPPYTFSPEVVKELKRQAKLLAKELRVKGLMNVQFAVKERKSDGSSSTSSLRDSVSPSLPTHDIYVIEVNPRASRTVPFVGKATGIPWAKIAAKVMAGKSLAELGYTKDPEDPKHVSVKEVVFPFSKFPGVDIILGPEMRSTGEVMGIDDNFPLAFAKSQLAAGTNLPLKGNVYISVRSSDRKAVVPIAQKLAKLGFTILTSSGTGATLAEAGVPNTVIPKLAEGRPNIIDKMKNGEIQLIINTPTKKGPATDEGKIRAASVMNRVPTFTTLTAASAAADAIEALQKTGWDVKPLQAYH